VLVATDRVHLLPPMAVAFARKERGDPTRGEPCSGRLLRDRGREGQAVSRVSGEMRHGRRRALKSTASAASRLQFANSPLETSQQDQIDEMRSAGNCWS
jgi:hypothetical protein